MTIASSQVAVAGTVLLADNTGDSPDAVRVYLTNASAAGTVYLGPSGVASTTGYAWVSTQPPFSLEVESGESLYGLNAAAGTVNVHVLKQDVG